MADQDGNIPAGTMRGDVGEWQSSRGLDVSVASQDGFFVFLLVGGTAKFIEVQPLSEADVDIVPTPNVAEGTVEQVPTPRPKRARAMNEKYMGQPTGR